MRDVSFVLAVLLSSAAPAADPDAALVARGRDLYQENGCRMCHSAEGRGNPKGVHDGVANKLSAEDIKLWLTKPAHMLEKAKEPRKLSMPAFSHLTAEEQDALVAFLQSLAPRAK